MSTVDSEIPFVHFFEGFKLSHQIDSINPLTMEQMQTLMPYEKLEAIRKRALNPTHPTVLGHSQGPDSYFQTTELGNPYYSNIPEIVQTNMDKLAAITGRQYHLFDYVGDKNATDVIVIMGAGAAVVEECLQHLNYKGLGVIIPRLYRPWSMADFVKVLPKTVKRISVLDRSKDPAAEGEPLFMDVAFTCKQMGINAQVTGGRYGLASREFNPLHAKAVVDNMRSAHPKERFTVGINDDVTHLSLPEAKLEGFGKSSDCRSAIFYGLGGDGTIGANKAAIKSAIDVMGKHAQGNFAYSADKSNALTRSYLRFSDKPITAHYTIIGADFVGCTLPAYVNTYPMAEKLNEGGRFFINAPWTTLEAVEDNIPASMKRMLAKKKASLYLCDATKVAIDCGMRGKISTIVQACFYQLTGILGKDWLKHTDKWIEKEFSRLGDDIVEKNKKSAREGIKHLIKIEIPESWENAVDEPGKFPVKTDLSFEKPKHPEYVDKVVMPCVETRGASLPVSAFTENNGGVSPIETTRYLKKGLSSDVPYWDKHKCIQCNTCSAVCPHSVIRPFLLTEEEMKNLPKQLGDLETVPAKGKELKGLQYRISISPYDCVGCQLCVKMCPANALSMKEMRSKQGVQNALRENDRFIYLADRIPNKGGLIKNRFSLKGSQFQKPMIEFPGSCEGCNETMVAKIVTQLFGPRMVIANTSGCSSVWGGASPRIPFTKDENGRGPAWGRSLFEDNAEYGYGMAVGLMVRRGNLLDDVKDILGNGNIVAQIPKLAPLLKEWVENFDDGDESLRLEKPIVEALEQYPHVDELKRLREGRDLWVKPSNWIFGGDGWAYDIGFGGLDHVLASKENFNVLVFDNETYSNTGGQQSKATNVGAVAQFAARGKSTPKKDLGFMMMQYDNIYVAQCAFGTQKDLQNLIKCLKEAESFDGPSLVICYCNCILHHIKGAVGAGGQGGINAQKLAVESGYWTTYSYDPRREKQGKNPLEIYSPEPDEKKLDEFLNMEVRYNSLKRQHPKEAEKYRKDIHKQILRRYRKYKAFQTMFSK